MTIKTDEANVSPCWLAIVTATSNAMQTCNSGPDFILSFKTYSSSPPHSFRRVLLYSPEVSSYRLKKKFMHIILNYTYSEYVTFS